jgi:beta-N-acetylhexosaminidase
VKFLSAGGDMVLTVDPTLVPTMAQAVLAAAKADAGFAASIATKAARVLALKASVGLSC